MKKVLGKIGFYMFWAGMITIILLIWLGINLVLFECIKNYSILAFSFILILNGSILVLLANL